MPRFKGRSIAVMTTAVALLSLAAPALAQEKPAESGGAISFASQFFHTDNMLGNMVIWFLMLISMSLISLIIKAFLDNRASAFAPPELVDQLGALIEEKKFREAIELVETEKSPFGRVMRATLAQAPRGFAAMEVALEETAEMLGNQRIRNLVFMEISGAAGPMMGLFGTVIGLILAFTQMVNSGGSPKATELAGGIATALVCTLWGLIVGIPGVISAAFFRVRVEGNMSNAIFIGQDLIEKFRPGSTASAPRHASAPNPQPTATKPAEA